MGAASTAAVAAASTAAVELVSAVFMELSADVADLGVEVVSAGGVVFTTDEDGMDGVDADTVTDTDTAVTDGHTATDHTVTDGRIMTRFVVSMMITPIPSRRPPIIPITGRRTIITFPRQAARITQMILRRLTIAHKTARTRHRMPRGIIRSATSGALA